MNELIERVAKLPNNQKIGIVVIVYLLVAVGYFFLLYQPQGEALEALKTSQEQLLAEKQETQAIADNLESFRLEVEELNEELNRALKALPNERNFDQLMSRMETLAKRIGLEVLLLEPRPDDFKGFYAEVPFKLEVLGSYHEVALFFYRLGTMARIVNVQDITMSNPELKGGKMVLKTNAVATTYRFLDEEERKQAKTKGKGKRRRKK